jgi:hypothetical protein
MTPLKLQRILKERLMVTGLKITLEVFYFE